MSDWYPKKTFGSLPAIMAERFGDRESLVFEDHRESFEAFSAQVDRVARGLIALGIQPGDHVALWLLNRPEWLYLMFALAKVGAVQVPVNTRFRTGDLEYLLQQSESAFLITHDRSGPVDYLGMVRQVVDLSETGAAVADPSFPRLRSVVILGEGEHAGTIAFEALLAGADSVGASELARRADSVDPDAPVFIMYTSGTTGFPKGVVHTHRLLHMIEERAFRMAITHNDVILNYLPLFHLFGYSEGALMSLLTGAKHVVTETFDPDLCLRLIEEEQATIIHGFETHFKDLTEAQERQGRDVSTLRTGVLAAGMQSAVPIVERAAAAFPSARFVTGYGMSEMGAGTLIGSLDDDVAHRAETSGFPAPGCSFRIADPETGAEQPVGVPGEMLFKGPSLMQGYYKKPEETAASFDADGWFHTGDTGMWCEDGCIRFLGRYKDMLKVGGENVDPMEVEALLLQHADVQQVAVVSYPDARLTEVPVAFVQRAKGSEIEASAVIEYCRGKVASFKIPRHVLFIDEFPMTASGKIRKVELRNEALERLDSNSA